MYSQLLREIVSANHDIEIETQIQVTLSEWIVEVVTVREVRWCRSNNRQWLKWEWYSTNADKEFHNVLSMKWRLEQWTKLDVVIVTRPRYSSSIKPSNFSDVDNLIHENSAKWIIQITINQWR